MKKKCIVITFDQIIIAIFAVIIFFYGIFAIASPAFAAKRKVPIYRVDRDDKKIAITFDASWGADKTLKIIEKVKSYDATATFFLVSFWAEKYPNEVNAIKDAGFEIGTHSKTHPHFNSLSYDKAYEEVASSIKTLEEIAGVTPKVFRAPFGEYNNQLINITETLNLLAVQWDVDSLDWKGISAEEISSRILKSTTSGSIILCHNNSDNILAALDIVLPALIARGFKFVHVSELLHADNYFVDNNGIQRKNG